MVTRSPFPPPGCSGLTCALTIPPPLPAACTHFVQMTSLTLLLACRDGGDGLLVQLGSTAGAALLCVAAWLTVHSLVLYLRGLWRFMAA